MKAPSTIAAIMMIAAALNVNAQSPLQRIRSLSESDLREKTSCEGVTTKNDEFNQYTLTESQRLKGRYNIQVSKILTTKEGIVIYRLIISYTDKYSDYTDGMALKLVDGTIIEGERSTVRCSYVGDGSYLHIGVLDIYEEDTEKLKQNRIEKIKVGVQENNIPEKVSTTIIEYSNCVF